MKTASTWKRFCARGIDQMILAVIILPLLYVFPSNEGWIYLPLSAALGLAIIPLVYEAAFYFLMGATPGKWIFSLKVVPVGGRNYKSWGGRVLVRSVSTYLSLIFGWTIYVTGFFNAERRHICDWLGETRVVGVDEVPPLKSRSILALFLIFVGVPFGLLEARHRFGMMSIEHNRVKMPDPFDFSVMLSSEEN